MSAIRLSTAFCLLVAAPTYAQTPAVEFEGYFARTEPAVVADAAQSLPLLPAVCALAPDRIAIAGATERMPSTARDDTDASAHVVASTPNLPRR